MGCGASSTSSAAESQIAQASPLPASDHRRHLSSAPEIEIFQSPAIDAALASKTSGGGMYSRSASKRVAKQLNDDSSATTGAAPPTTIDASASSEAQQLQLISSQKGLTSMRSKVKLAPLTGTAVTAAATADDSNEPTDDTPPSVVGGVVARKMRHRTAPSKPFAASAPRNSNKHNKTVNKKSIKEDGSGIDMITSAETDAAVATNNAPDEQQPIVTKTSRRMRRNSSFDATNSRAPTTTQLMPATHQHPDGTASQNSTSLKSKNAKAQLALKSQQKNIFDTNKAKIDAILAASNPNPKTRSGGNTPLNSLGLSSHKKKPVATASNKSANAKNRLASQRDLDFDLLEHSMQMIISSHLALQSTSARTTTGATQEQQSTDAQTKVWETRSLKQAQKKKSQQPQQQQQQSEQQEMPTQPQTDIAVK